MSLKRSRDSSMKAIIEYIGFSEKVNDTNHNLIKKDGSFNIIRKGEIKSSLYEHLIEGSWIFFFLEFIIVFCLINAFFAYLFCQVGLENIGGIEPNSGDFLTAFFFSIQTFTTVGYGAMYPISTSAHIVASLSAFFGLVLFAVFTSILFSRFSKAKTHISFSDNILLSPYEGVTALMFRIVNLSNNNIINLKANMTMTYLQKENGIYRRKFARLPLELDFIYLFPLNWTIVHKIDESSPLFGLSCEQMEKSYTEFLIMINGYDDTYDKNVYSNYSYDAVEIEQNAVFDVMYESKDESTTLHLEKLSDFTKIANLKDNN